MKILVERFNRNKDWRSPTEKEFKVMWSIWRKYQEDNESMEKFLRYLVTIGFYDWILNNIDYNCRTNSQTDLSELVKIMDEFVIYDFIFDILSKTNILLICTKVIDSNRIEKN